MFFYKNEEKDKLERERNKEEEHIDRTQDMQHITLFNEVHQIHV